MKPDVKKELIKMTAGRILFDEPMSEHTTFGIGGPAAGFCYPESKSELIRLLQFAASEGLAVYYVGSGSNLLVSDEGFDGIVISLAKSFKRLEIGQKGSVYCEAGVMTGSFVKNVVNAGLTGVETLIGVPGTVGGALVMNAGAFGNEISEYLKQVSVILPSGDEKTYEKGDVKFGYRESSFQNDELIIWAEFTFPEGERTEITHRKEMASLKRRENQPLRNRSAGSIFKNPETFAAGYLIDRVGLKGTRAGDAMISGQHANFIVNLGQATAENVLSLISMARAKVSEQFGVNLELEVELMGFSREMLEAYSVV